MMSHTNYERSLVPQLLLGFSLRFWIQNKGWNSQVFLKDWGLFARPSLSTGVNFIEKFQQRQFFASFCAPVLKLLLTVYHHNVQSRTHFVQHVTHDAVKNKKRLGAISFVILHSWRFLCASVTHIFPSKQIWGPAMLAAPLVRRTAKCWEGQTLGSLHFCSAKAWTETHPGKVKQPFRLLQPCYAVWVSPALNCALIRSM